MVSLAADEVIQTTRTFESHISSWSFQHSTAFRTSLTETSIFLTSGSAEEIDREQGIEHTTMTHVLFTGVDRPDGATSGGDETGVDVNTTVWRIRDFSTLLARIPFAARLLAFVCPCRRTWNPNFCVRICTCPSSASALGNVFTRNRCTVCAFVVTFGTLSRSRPICR